MLKSKSEFVHEELSFKIIGVLYQVFNELGPGYQEKYYQKAVAVGFNNAGITFKEQVSIPLEFQGTKIGNYYLDFLVEDTIVLEIKKGDYFAPTNIKQVNAYLKATGLQLGILANFTSKEVRIKRIVNIK